MKHLPPDLSTADLEQLANQHPDDANVLVRLANAYWLEGRGPQLVDEIALRAKTLDPAKIVAHGIYGALAEPTPRDRVARWRQVTEQFPEDDLARAALADNAASLAGAEHDVVALDLAIKMYEQLLRTAQLPDQKVALGACCYGTLKGWRL